MKPIDAKLVADFLLEDFERFSKYLEDCAIDPSEASLIIDEIAGESNGGIPTCLQQFSGFIGE